MPDFCWSGRVDCVSVPFPAPLAARRSAPRPAATHYTPIKNTFIILLSALVLFGCSEKKADPGGGQPEARQSPRPATDAPRPQEQAPAVTSALDRVIAGQDVAWSNGYVLHVASRDGASVGGVRITYKGPDGQVATTTADKGTISCSGAMEVHGVLYTNFVRIVLENARSQRADGTVQEHKEARFTLR